LQTSVSYLRPTPIARVIARGEVLRFGASSVAMQGTLRDAEGQVLALATATAVPRPFPRP
jgi:acyl-coenzyme A thioesterase PaaI-like protein